MPAPDTRAPATSDRAGLGHQIKKHPFIALGLAIVTSLIAGWAIGSWTTCGPRCGFDVDLFGAWGAWVGGLATAGAFFFTAHELVSSRRREEKMDRLRAEEVLTKARQVLFGFWSLKKDEPPILLRMNNYSSSPITNIRVLAGRAQKEMGRRDQLDAWDPELWRSSWTFEIDPTDLGLVRAEFTLEGHRFQWDSNTREVELIANPHA